MIVDKQKVEQSVRQTILRFRQQNFNLEETKKFIECIQALLDHQIAKKERRKILDKLDLEMDEIGKSHKKQ